MAKKFLKNSQKPKQETNNFLKGEIYFATHYRTFERIIGLKLYKNRKKFCMLALEPIFISNSNLKKFLRISVFDLKKRIQQRIRKYSLLVNNLERNFKKLSP